MQAARRVAEAIAKHPEWVADAPALLALCERANANLAKLSAQATRNPVSLKFYAHDVLVMRTAARRIMVTQQLVDKYAEAQKLSAEQARATLLPVIEGLKSLVTDYAKIEQGFADSILEAGGGPCGTGGWVPYINGGGIIFRAPQGRAELQKQIAYLEKAMAEGKLPAEVFAR